MADPRFALQSASLRSRERPANFQPHCGPAAGSISNSAQTETSEELWAANQRQPSVRIQMHLHRPGGCSDPGLQSCVLAALAREVLLKGAGCYYVFSALQYSWFCSCQ